MGAMWRAYGDLYQTVEYHSARWGELVTLGWITMTVQQGEALMIYQGRGRR